MPLLLPNVANRPLPGVNVSLTPRGDLVGFNQQQINAVGRDLGVVANEFGQIADRIAANVQSAKAIDMQQRLNTIQHAISTAVNPEDLDEPQAALSSFLDDNLKDYALNDQALMNRFTAQVGNMEAGAAAASLGLFQNESLQLLEDAARTASLSDDPMSHETFVGVVEDHRDILPHASIDKILRVGVPQIVRQQLVRQMQRDPQELRARLFDLGEEGMDFDPQMSLLTPEERTSLISHTGRLATQRDLEDEVYRYGDHVAQWEMAITDGIISQENTPMLAEVLGLQPGEAISTWSREALVALDTLAPGVDEFDSAEAAASFGLVEGGNGYLTLPTWIRFRKIIRDQMAANAEADAEIGSFWRYYSQAHDKINLPLEVPNFGSKDWQNVADPAFDQLMKRDNITSDTPTPDFLGWLDEHWLSRVPITPKMADSFWHASQTSNPAQVARAMGTLQAVMDSPTYPQGPQYNEDQTLEILRWKDLKRRTQPGRNVGLHVPSDLELATEFITDREWMRKHPDQKPPQVKKANQSVRRMNTFSDVGPQTVSQLAESYVEDEAGDGTFFANMAGSLWRGQARQFQPHVLGISNGLWEHDPIIPNQGRLTDSAWTEDALDFFRWLGTPIGLDEFPTDSGEYFDLVRDHRQRAQENATGINTQGVTGGISGLISTMSPLVATARGIFAGPDIPKPPDQMETDFKNNFIRLRNLHPDTIYSDDVIAEMAMKQVDGVWGVTHMGLEMRPTWTQHPAEWSPKFGTVWGSAAAAFAQKKVLAEHLNQKYPQFEFDPSMVGLDVNTPPVMSDHGPVYSVIVAIPRKDGTLQQVRIPSGAEGWEGWIPNASQPNLDTSLAGQYESGFERIGAQVGEWTTKGMLNAIGLLEEAGDTVGLQRTVQDNEEKAALLEKRMQARPAQHMARLWLASQGYDPSLPADKELTSEQGETLVRVFNDQASEAEVDILLEQLGSTMSSRQLRALQDIAELPRVPVRQQQSGVR